MAEEGWVAEEGCNLPPESEEAEATEKVEHLEAEGLTAEGLAAVEMVEAD